MTAAPVRQVVYGATGKVRGYTIGGEYFSRRQFDKRFGRFAGTNLTPERQRQQNIAAGTPGARLRPQPAPQPAVQATQRPQPARPRTRDRFGRFSSYDERKVRSGRMVQADFPVDDDLDSTEFRARSYIGTLEPRAQVWVQAFGIVDRNSTSWRPTMRYGWLTISGFRERDIQLRTDWNYGDFEDVELIRVVWELR